MADKTELPDDNNESIDTTEDQEETNGDGAENHRQEIFDAIFHDLMDGFGEACQKEDVEICMAVVKHPKFEQPMVFYRARHIVDAGAMIAGVLREIKRDVDASLDTVPD